MARCPDSRNGKHAFSETRRKKSFESGKIVWIVFWRCDFCGTTTVTVEGR